MRRTLILTVLLALAAGPAAALSPGSDVLVPAAARVAGGVWVTDLYIMNPNPDSVTVTVAWLVRDQPNPDPTALPGFNLAPGATLIMEDVIFTEFGQDEGAGAFRVTSDGGDLVVNSRIYNREAGPTFGQGFEGVPATLATPAGTTTQIVGLSVNAAFRTNFYALTGDDGATVELVLVDPDGAEIARRTRTFGRYQPYLKPLATALDASLGTVDDASLLVTVTDGSAVVGASKVDNASSDPTTLESAVAASAAGGSTDGTYQFAVYDSESYATGGNLVIEDGEVVAINGTYTNWDKNTDGDDVFDCTLLFLFGFGLTPAPVADFADGEEFTDSYTNTGSGVITYTVQFEMTSATAFSGTVSAVGAEFPSDPDPLFDQSGCNGEFPDLVMFGGKVE